MSLLDKKSGYYWGILFCHFELQLLLLFLANLGKNLKYLRIEKCKSAIISFAVGACLGQLDDSNGGLIIDFTSTKLDRNLFKKNNGSSVRSEMEVGTDLRIFSSSINGLHFCYTNIKHINYESSNRLDEQFNLSPRWT